MEYVPGDSPEESFEEAFQALIDDGLIEVKGVDVSGEMTYGLTEKGEVAGAQLLEDLRDDEDA
jgi:DNA-binding PadR family transcriptional regulator